VRSRAISIPVTIRKGIPAWSFGKSQLVNIARERGLGHLKATAAKLAAHLVLVGHQGMRYKFPNRIVPLKLHFLFRTKQKRGSQWRPRLHKYTKKLYNYASWFSRYQRAGSPK
jgi:hypothetical protein